MVGREALERFREAGESSGVGGEKRGLLFASEVRRQQLEELFDQLSEEMHEAADWITPIVNTKVEAADRLEAETKIRIEATSSADARKMLWIAGLATALGALFAVAITIQITRPLRHMMGLLGLVADEDPTERIATWPGARDEVNLMAESVNAIADHKHGLIRWWKEEHGLSEAS